MASTDAIIKVDTSQLDEATKKMEYLIELTEKLYKLLDKSKLLRFILGVKNV